MNFLLLLLLLGTTWLEAANIFKYSRLQRASWQWHMRIKGYPFF